MSEPRTTTRKSTRRVATPETAVTAETTDGQVSHDEIAQRAYEIAHGPEGGSEEENWLRAEQELRSRSTTSS
jgi:hypothetical protein